jgi:Zn ribbon nucleic-acid-binding protein
MHRQVCGYIRQ